MCRYRQRRFSASDSSRVLFEVRKTIGSWVARTVPSSGIDTWYSERISSSRASVSSSTRSTSSTSRTTGSSARIASSSGRVSRKSSEKMSSSSSSSPGPAAVALAGPTWPAWMRSSCLR